MNDNKMDTANLLVGVAAVFRYPLEWSRITVYRRTGSLVGWTQDGYLTFQAGDPPVAPIRTSGGGSLLIGAPGVAIHPDRVSIPWGDEVSGIAAVADDATTPDVVLIVATDIDGGLVQSTVYRVRLVLDDHLSSLIARDEAFLGVLVAARHESADTRGLVQVQFPDGRTEIYRNPATLSLAIAELDARLSILRASRSGAQFVGQTYR